MRSVPNTAADLCIEAFAAEALDLHTDLLAYRELLSVAMVQLREAEGRQVVLSRQMQAVRDELRRYVAAKVSV